MGIFDFLKPFTSEVPDDDIGRWSMLAAAMYIEDNWVLSQLEDRFPDLYKDLREMIQTSAIQGTPQPAVGGLIGAWAKKFSQDDSHYNPYEDDEDEDIASLKDGLETLFWCLDILGLDSDEAEDISREFLRDGWEINNKTELVEQLDSLLGGQTEVSTEEFRDFPEPFLRNDGSVNTSEVERYLSLTKYPEMIRDIDTEEMPYVLEYLRRTTHAKWNIGFLGWDYARYSHIVRLGYLAGYLDVSTAWMHARRIVPRMQKAFSSWEEFAESYLAGRIRWLRNDGGMREVCDRLLSHPLSPWKAFGWISWQTEGFEAKVRKES